MPDLFNFWLCGVKANEFTIATTSQMYDPKSGDWAFLINRLICKVFDANYWKSFVHARPAGREKQSTTFLQHHKIISSCK